MCSFFIRVAVCLGLFVSAARADELLIFSASWCPACVKLKKTIEADPAIVDGFTTTLIDIDVNPEIAKAHGVKRLPTILRVGLNGQTKRKIGFQSAEDFKKWLQNSN